MLELQVMDTNIEIINRRDHEMVKQSYPRVEINLQYFKENVEAVVKLSLIHI